MKRFRLGGTLAILLVLLAHPSLLGATGDCTGRRGECGNACCLQKAAKPSCHTARAAADCGWEARCQHRESGWSALPWAVVPTPELLEGIRPAGPSLQISPPLARDSLRALDSPPPRLAPPRS